MKDPTPARLATLQRYLKQLNKSGELHDNTFKKIQPQSAKIARAHGLPKMHKHFDNNPSFWPIVDTTGTRYYSAGKYLSELLNPLTRNEYSLRDSFDATNRINRMLLLVQENEECRFVSLDVVSLFTNVPLYKTVNIILKRVNSEKLIQTSLSKHSLKTLILDTCQKTTLSFNNKLYEQIDGESMGGSLGPVLANIIMTECKKVIVHKLMKEKVIMFYTGYVDDTLLITKKRDINYVLNQFNSFDKNLKFTIDTFENSVPHFLDIEIGLGIYHKHTQTGQYVHITSYTLWRWKTSWIRSLVIRAKNICSANYFDNEIQLIKRYAAWNGYPRNVVNGIVKHTLRSNDNNNTFNDNDIDVAVRIYINIKYSGETADTLIKKCIKERYNCFKKDKRVKFVLQYETTKLSYFTNTKDKISLLSQLSVVYKFVCPGCSSSYIGKTERNLWERTEEHAYKNNNLKEQSAIYEQLLTCEHYNHVVDLFNVVSNSFNLNKFNICLIKA